MANDKQDQPARAALDLSELGDAEPQPVRNDPGSIEKIKEVSEKAGFPSREPAVKQVKPAKSWRARTRPKTGRTYPFNTKIKPETYKLICELADTTSEREGRVVSMAEIIERAIDNLNAA